MFYSAGVGSMGMGMPLGWHRRAAVTLVSQLPDDSADALLVLEAAKELVEKFLLNHADEVQQIASNVIPFGQG